MPTTKPLHPETVRLLETARAFIADNFASNPTLTDVAGAAGMSAFHFHRLFRQHFGVTPKGMIDGLRIEGAKELIREGLGLVEVAEAMGYAHQSHLTVRFAKAAGISPGRWRRRGCED